MLLKTWSTTGALVLALGAVAGARASTLTYTATLSGSQESPANVSTASGTATLTLTGNMLTVNESWTGLSAPATAAHIHCCSGPGVNSFVEVPFLMFPNTTSGTYTQSFDLNTFMFSTPGFTESDFLLGLNSGLAYVNIHDVNFAAGEIRGQLTPSVVGFAPEPGGFLLLATGAAAIAGAVRRRLRA